jgi:uncharacterized membrane protein
MMISALPEARGPNSTRKWVRWVLAALYSFIGVVHFTSTDTILLIMPNWVPEPRLVILITGALEIAGAVALLTPRLRPANIKHAVEGISVPGLPSSWWYHGPRLAAQPVLIWLALYAAELIDWPFRARPEPS